MGAQALRLPARGGEGDLPGATLGPLDLTACARKGNPAILEASAILSGRHADLRGKGL